MNIIKLNVTQEELNKNEGALNLISSKMWTDNYVDCDYRVELEPKGELNILYLTLWYCEGDNNEFKKVDSVLVPTGRNGVNLKELTNKVEELLVRNEVLDSFILNDDDSLDISNVTVEDMNEFTTAYYISEVAHENYRSVKETATYLVKLLLDYDCIEIWGDISDREVRSRITRLAIVMNDYSRNRIEDIIAMVSDCQEIDDEYYNKRREQARQIVETILNIELDNL